MKTNSLGSWSWQSIQAVYKSYGTLLGQYAEIDKRLNLPRTMHIDFGDNDNIFIMRFWKDVNRIEEQLQCLDAEIARRNNLIGVMG